MNDKIEIKTDTFDEFILKWQQLSAMEENDYEWNKQIMNELFTVIKIEA